MILGYTRCSTDEQAAPDKSTLAEQERVIRALATMKGVKSSDVLIFSDPGISGSVPLDRRPGGNALLESAKAGDVVVACKLDRIFRSAADALSTADALKKRQVNLILVDIGNEPVTSNGSAKLFFGILASIAEFERERIIERITVGLRAKVARGGCGGGPPPYGFNKVGVGKAAVLEPNPREQLILKTIHGLHKLGRTPWEITKILKEKRVKNRKHGNFQMQHIQLFLSRPFGDPEVNAQAPAAESGMQAPAADSMETGSGG